jgi:hypothetical protein
LSRIRKFHFKAKPNSRSLGKYIETIAGIWNGLDFAVEENNMSKKIESQLASSRKWLERNDSVGSTVKPAQAAIAAAEKAVAEAKAAKATYTTAVAAKKKAVLAMGAAMVKTKTEKKLKAKELRLQTKLATLVAPEKADQAAKV